MCNRYNRAKVAEVQAFERAIADIVGKLLADHAAETWGWLEEYMPVACQGEGGGALSMMRWGVWPYYEKELKSRLVWSTRATMRSSRRTSGNTPRAISAAWRRPTGFLNGRARRAQRGECVSACPRIGRYSLAASGRAIRWAAIADSHERYLMACEGVLVGVGRRPCPG